jgi:hypothetical protein
MILLVAEPKDVHARVVARRLEMRGARHAIVNSADFPGKLRISAEYGNGRFAVRMANGAPIVDGEEIRGLWLRRFHAHEISPEIADEAVAAFAYRESRELFLGWTASVKNVINPRNEEWRAELKPFQLFAAQEVGLTIPRTIVSNDPDEIRTFAASVDGEVVFKVLSATAFQFTATTPLEVDHLTMLEGVRLAPTIFQERIHADRHLRITVVDDSIFTAAIEPVRTEGMLDWRLDRDPRMEPFDLPAPVAEKVLALRRRLGLRFGAIDMILDRDGRYVFLEINPGGQWLFAEIHAGLPISEAIADALMG